MKWAFSELGVLFLGHPKPVAQITPMLGGLWRSHVWSRKGAYSSATFRSPEDAQEFAEFTAGEEA